jgi:hypothetical protein
MLELASGERLGNAQVFATHDEAEASAKHRFFNWTMPTDYGVDETDDPVNYRWDPDRGGVRMEGTSNA